jgi:hypothetical protein
MRCGCNVQEMSRCPSRIQLSRKRLEGLYRRLAQAQPVMVGASRPHHGRRERSNGSKQGENALTIVPQRSGNGYSAKFNIDLTDKERDNVGNWDLGDFSYGEIKGEKWNIWRLSNGIGAEFQADTKEEVERVIEQINAKHAEFRQRYAERKESEMSRRRFSKGQSETF